MYVVIIARGIPRERAELNGIFEFDQAMSLQKIGCKVILASLDLRSLRRWRSWGVTHLFVSGIEVYEMSIPLGNVPRKVLYYAGKIGLIILFKRILSDHGRPNLVHAHFSIIGAIASSLKKRYDLPMVVTEHSSIMHKNKISRTNYSIGKIAYHSADKVISVSSSLAEMIKRHYGIDTLIIHNVVDSSIFTFHRKLWEKKFIFISVGSLIPIKGHDILIKAFHKANFGKEVQLLIIGEGILHSKLQKLIDKLDLTRQIMLLGIKNRAEIGELMKRSNAFVLASRSETFGLAFCEAMLAGLPVIATACGGPQEFVNEQNGILLQKNSIDDLTDALTNMRKNITRYNGEKISEQCWNRFSPEVIASKLLEVYQNIICKTK
jgi:L-malate glycosyltransferase